MTKKSATSDFWWRRSYEGDYLIAIVMLVPPHGDIQYTFPWEVAGHEWKLLAKDVRDEWESMEEQLWATRVGLA